MVNKQEKSLANISSKSKLQPHMQISLAVRVNIKQAA